VTDFRTWTPDARTETGHIVRVKRACNGCATLIGDVTEAEIEEVVNGLPLRDVTAECPRCTDRWPAALTEIARLRAELVEEQTVHAKTFDNFESHAEACLEERTRQLDRYARLELHADRLRTSLDSMSALCAAVTAERDEARAAVRAAEDARAER
jgi:hypothetical protein